MPRALPALVLAGLVLGPPAHAGVVINEVMASPQADWSGDGRSSAVDDEWIELANTSAEVEDLDALFVADGDAPCVPRVGLSGSLAPGAVRFVTGEHALDWQGEHGAPAEGLALDAVDSVELYRVADGGVRRVDGLAWPASAPDVSWGRWPDGTGAFMPFDALAGGTGPQPTPGGANDGIAGPKILELLRDPAAPTSADAVRVRAHVGDAGGIVECTLTYRVDGGIPETLSMARVDGTAAVGTWERTVPGLPAGSTVTYHVVVSDGSLIAMSNDETYVVAPAVVEVALNEILADPPPDPDGDANGDGVRSSGDDEFVEIMNLGPVPVDLSGWSLADSTSVRHVFPSGVVLAPGAFYVVFGGGDPAGIPSQVDVASTGTLSLNNTADGVRLLDGTGAAVDAHSYGTEANADQSVLRIPDGDGPWTRPHDAGMAWAYSPGRANASPAAVEAVSWARIKALYGP